MLPTKREGIGTPALVEMEAEAVASALTSQAPGVAAAAPVPLEGHGSPALHVPRSPGEPSVSTGVARLWAQNDMDVRLAQVARLAVALFPELGGPGGIQPDLAALALAAYKRTDLLFNAKDAVAWAGGYTVPQSVVDSDEGLFRAHLRDFDSMVRRRRAQLRAGRMNPERIHASLSPDNPEIDKLLSLATTGMTVHLPPGFQPNTERDRVNLPKLGQLYSAAAPAVNKMEMEQFHGQRMAFVLTKETALSIPGTHLSPFGWAPKDGKRQGRPTTNASGAGPGNQCLNDKNVKEACDRQWGEIKHPTIAQIAQMVTGFITDEGTRRGSGPRDWVLWKMDLRGAYNLIDFRVEDVRLMANEMTGGLVIYHMCGQFGWTGTPSAFQVVTRAIMFELRRRIPGRCVMYVDDIIGICGRGEAEATLSTVKQIVEGLLGEGNPGEDNGAIASTKTEFGRRITAIGYDIDLDLMLVAIATKNVHKAAYGFLTVDTEHSVAVKVLERLASWASRYGGICTEMLPVTKHIYSEYSGLRNMNCSILLSPQCRRAIRILRVLILLTALDETRFARSIQSFSPGAAEYVIEFDGSLTGAGILFFRCDSSGAETLLGGSAICLRSCGFNKGKRDRRSRNQNTAEFLTLMLGIRGLYLLGCVGGGKQTTVHLRGDSETALTWATTGRFRSLLCYNAATVYILQNQLLKVVCPSYENIKHEGNVAADILSRQPGSESLLADLTGDEKYRGMPAVDLKEEHLMSLATPSWAPQNEEEFEGWWARIREAVVAR